MSFLEEHWDKIKPRVPEGISHEECAALAFMRPWVHDNANMDMIVQAMLVLQPKVVLELGTFEGFGTVKMSSVMNTYRGGKLYTFDLAHSPANSLGVTYGCPPTFEEGPVVDWKNFPKEHQAAQGWKSWEKVIELRTKRLDIMGILPDVEVEFIEGLTYDTLPEVMPRIGIWDFCFQDTLHTTEHIIREWKLYREYTKVGSLMVFDDVTLHQNFAFVDWFRENEPDWIYKHTEIGHGQLWAERVKRGERKMTEKVMAEFVIHPEYGPLNRYLCLGCGRTWSFEAFRLVPAEHICPHCGDMYWCDNVIPTSPPYLYDKWQFAPKCGHVFISDTPGDVRFCTICGIGVEDDRPWEATLVNWQKSIIEELGL